MIIDFTVENYRSIREPVTLSAIAHPQRASQGNREGIKTDNEIAPPYIVEKRGFGLLPVLAIFGANASGKSNVVTALDNLLTLLRIEKGVTREILRKIVPFGLEETTAKSPTRFKLRVLSDEIIYTYTLVLNQSRILLERLDYLPEQSRRFRFLYQATWDASNESYTWENGPDFTGPHKRLQPSWLGAEPFLHIFLTQFSARPVQAFVNWLKGHWLGVNLSDDATTDQHIAVVIGQFRSDMHNEAVEFIRRFDTGLADIRVEWNKTETGEIDISKFNYRLIAAHDTRRGIVEWPFSEESGGTRSLFPLARKALFTLQFGKCAIVDELGANMHPNLTHEIVRMFQSQVTNPRRAQLIFTTHDATMQSDQLLRRDQIWFTEKRADGSTNLYPLTDFKERNDRNIRRAYLDGRYGAVPILPPLETLLPEEAA